MPPSTRNNLTLFTLTGALLGAIAGYYFFMYLAYRDIFGFAIPGAFVAIGAGINSRCPSRKIALLCGVIAFLAGNFALWKRLPYVQDTGFFYSLTHLFNRETIAWGMVLAGTFLAIWLPWRRIQKAA